jgi:inositol-phosphate phosphatase/L-galactose 1-phosphate phosphatase/histidinol-phosphatase
VIKPVPDALIGFAGQLAEASAAVIRQYFRAGIGIEIKPDKSPVTIADKETEAAIRKLIEARYPEHGVIGEEYGADRPDAEFVWILDPIDGTKSFISGRPTFGTLIALAHRGEPVLGVIDHPMLGERWIGASGHPTSHDGRPVRVRACSALDQAMMFASSPHYFDDIGAGAVFDRLRLAGRQVLYGSDCYAYGLVASGYGDLAIEANLGIYDYLAAVPVIEGAGGIVTDWQGKPLTIRSGDRMMAAGDRRIHQQVLEILAD